MISTEDKQSIIIGYKQVLKSLKNNSCTKVYIADDCSVNLRDSLLSVSGSAEIIHIPTMRELGNECGIDVGASCAAVLRL